MKYAVQRFGVLLVRDVHNINQPFQNAVANEVDVLHFRMSVWIVRKSDRPLISQNSVVGSEG
jgi:hypothetical protein